jgi:ligand-binding sensor domain-containing protein
MIRPLIAQLLRDHYDRSSNTWSIQWNTHAEDSPGRIQALVFSRNGTVWVGTRENGLRQYRIVDDQWLFVKEGLPYEDIRRILEATTGRLWVGTGGNGLFISDNGGLTWQKVTIEEGFSDDTVVYEMYEDSRNHIWIGAAGALYRYAPETEEWSIYTSGSPRYNSMTGEWTKTSKEQAVLSRSTIQSISEGEDGILWFATLGEQGVERYDPIENQWTTFTTEDGLINNKVSAIAVDRENRVWMGTAKGMSRYDTTSGEWQSFTQAQGYTSFFYTWDILVDSQGNLWAAVPGRGIYYYEMR